MMVALSFKARSSPTANVIDSPEVLEPVLAHLKLTMSPQALASNVGV